jgi:hypothetical protein
VTGGRLEKNAYQEFYRLYCSQYTVSVVKARRLRWAGHVACIFEDEKGTQNFD